MQTPDRHRALHYYAIQYARSKTVKLGNSKLKFYFLVNQRSFQDLGQNEASSTLFLQTPDGRRALHYYTMQYARSKTVKLGYNAILYSKYVEIFKLERLQKARKEKLQPLIAFFSGTY